MMDARIYCIQAADLVAGERAQQHGDMLRTHENIAALWTAWLKQRGAIAADLTAQDVAMMMVLLKAARTLVGSHNQDNFRDMIGYAAIAGHLADLEDDLAECHR